MCDIIVKIQKMAKFCDNLNSKINCGCSWNGLGYYFFHLYLRLFLILLGYGSPV